MESGPALILRTLDKHLTAQGRVRLFGGAALILGYGSQRQTEDADLLLDDAECRALIDNAGLGEAVEATNRELNPLGLYLTHIFGPEREILSAGWRERCRKVEIEGLTRLEVSALAAVDLVLTKLGRGDEGDFYDIRFLLKTRRVDPQTLRAVLAQAEVPEVLREIFITSRTNLLRLLDESAAEH